MQNTSSSTIRVKLFAAARQAASTDALEIAINESSTVKDMNQSVIEQFPALERIISQSRWAINGEYALENDVIPIGGEIALIPPVSGG